MIEVDSIILGVILDISSIMTNRSYSYINGLNVKEQDYHSLNFHNLITLL